MILKIHIFYSIPFQQNLKTLKQELLNAGHTITVPESEHLVTSIAFQGVLPKKSCLRKKKKPPDKMTRYFYELPP